MPEDIMPLITWNDFLEWAQTHPIKNTENPYTRERYKEAQRDADLAVLQSERAKWAKDLLALPTNEFHTELGMSFSISLTKEQYAAHRKQAGLEEK